MRRRIYRISKRAAQNKGSRPGYEKHHIVEKGKQNDDLKPSEKERIESDENIVSIPYAAHRCITAYYQTKMRNDPEGNGDNSDEDAMTPREYLRGKSFEEKFNFGLEIMKICRVLRK